MYEATTSSAGVWGEGLWTDIQDTLTELEDLVAHQDETGELEPLVSRLRSLLATLAEE